jgi:type II secretory pathway pseudopilin PulG
MLTRFGQTDKRKAVPPFGQFAYTLVEVVMGVAIIAFILASVFAGFASGFGIINTTRQDLLATQILTQNTEAIRLCTWGQLATLPHSFQQSYNVTGTTNNTTGTIYYGTISVGAATMIPNTVSYYSNIDLVTISLVWTNYLHGHTVVHNRQMQTLSALNGIQNYIYGLSPP